MYKKWDDLRISLHNLRGVNINYEPMIDLASPSMFVVGNEWFVVPSLVEAS